MAQSITEAEKRQLLEMLRRSSLPPDPQPWHVADPNGPLATMVLPHMRPNLYGPPHVNPNGYPKPIGPPSRETMRQWLASQPGANWPEPTFTPDQPYKREQIWPFGDVFKINPVERRGAGIYNNGARLYQDTPDATQRLNSGTRLPPEYQPLKNPNGPQIDLGLAGFRADGPEKISYSMSNDGPEPRLSIGQDAKGRWTIPASPGRNPNIAKVDHRLVEIMAAAAQHLPAGYRVTVNEGYNPAGHVPKSQHHQAGKGALDLQIWGPDGGKIPNRGKDTTGMYTQLARYGYGEMLARYPELKGKFAFGGTFGTTRGSGVPDLMHFDIGGERGTLGPYVSQLGPMPGVQYGNGAGTAFAALEPGQFQGPGPYLRPVMAANDIRGGPFAHLSPEAFASLKPGANAIAPQPFNLAVNGSLGTTTGISPVTGQLARNYPPNPNLRPDAQTAIAQNFGIPATAPMTATSFLPSPPIPNLRPSADTVPNITVSPPADSYGVRPMLAALASNDPAGVKSAADKTLGAIYRIAPNTNPLGSGGPSPFRMPDAMKVGSELERAMTEVTQSDPFLVKNAAAAIQKNPALLKQLPEHFQPIVLNGASQVNQLGDTIGGLKQSATDWWNTPAAYAPEARPSNVPPPQTSPFDNLKNTASSAASNIWSFLSQPKPENASPPIVPRTINPVAAGTSTRGYEPPVMPLGYPTQEQRDNYPTFDTHVPGAMPGYDPLWTRPNIPSWNVHQPTTQFASRPTDLVPYASMQLNTAHGGGGHGVDAEPIAPPQMMPAPRPRPIYTSPPQPAPINRIVEQAQRNPGFLAALFGGLFGGGRGTNGVANGGQFMPAANGGNPTYQFNPHTNSYGYY